MDQLTQVVEPISEADCIVVLEAMEIWLYGLIAAKTREYQFYQEMNNALMAEGVGHECRKYEKYRMAISKVLADMVKVEG